MASMNYYELFGIPVSYTLDEVRLTNIYLEKQSVAHPDASASLKAGANAGWKTLGLVGCNPANNVVDDVSCPRSERLSVDLNVAYDTLMNAVKRAEYFLALHGLRIDDISVHYAAEMFAISEQYGTLKTLSEKLDFQQQLVCRMKGMEKSLAAVEGNLAEFCKRAVLLRFIGSFLEKVRLDAYNRN
ncbi:MAG: hypothetical protein LBT90_03185 [Holosporaceae bacterium]|jgi:curved DNA-binding protein CbpA|nr:hypothetical protein [Holosporaceae bacterium]